jgi:hypothetical protein
MIGALIGSILISAVPGAPVARPGSDSSHAEHAEALAKSLGLQLGGHGIPFAGNYGVKGLYAYSSGDYKGMAFFGTGGTNAEMIAPVTSPSQYRPAAASRILTISGNWRVIDTNKNCNTGDLFSRNNFGTLDDCKTKCQATPSCVTVNYFEETRWCALSTELCNNPRFVHHGASSHQLLGREPVLAASWAAGKGGDDSAHLISASILSVKLSVVENEVGQCDSAAQGIVAGIADLESGAAGATRTISKVKHINNKIESFIGRLARKDVAAVLGRAPVYGSAIKAGLAIGKQASKAMNRVLTAAEKVSKKTRKAISLTEGVFEGVADRTATAAAILHAGSIVQASALECARAGPIPTQASEDFNSASSAALAQIDGAIDLAASAGRECSGQLEEFRRTINAVARLTKIVAGMIDPLDKILGVVDKAITAANDIVEGILASSGVQCLLGLTEFARAGAALVACPAETALDSVVSKFEEMVQELLDNLVGFMNEQAGNLIHEAVDLLVPDELDFTIPNFLRELTALVPSDWRLAQCTAKKVDAELGIASAAADKIFEVAGFSQYRSYLDGGIEALDSLKPDGYRVTAAHIEQRIFDELAERVELDPKVGEVKKFHSACVQAWKDIQDTELLNFEECADLFEDAVGVADGFVAGFSGVANDVGNAISSVWCLGFCS